MGHTLLDRLKDGGFELPVGVCNWKLPFLAVGASPNLHQARKWTVKTSFVPFSSWSSPPLAGVLAASLGLAGVLRGLLLAVERAGVPWPGSPLATFLLLAVAFLAFLPSIGPLCLGPSCSRPASCFWRPTEAAGVWEGRGRRARSVGTVHSARLSNRYILVFGSLGDEGPRGAPSLPPTFLISPS